MSLTAVFKVRDQGTAKLRQLTQTMDKMNRSSRITSDSMSRAQSSVSQLGSTASSTSSHLDGLKSKLAGLGAAVGVGAVAKSVVSIGAEFEASMSKVAAVSGATGSDLALLESKAREMGANTNKSASEAADALGYMALAGWDTQQMLGGIEPILKLSAAGNMELGRTSDLVTDSMAAMGLTVQDLPGYLDMVAQASRRSNTEIESLMDAFLVSGGQFASLNVPLAESTSLLGILANRGYKGAEAGTAMNAILTNLTTKGGESGKAMKQLGISMWDAQGNFVGLEAGLLKVKDKLSGLTQEQRNQAISMIAGKEHLKTFQALLSGLGAEYGSLKDDISNSSGVLEKLYKIMTDNLKGDWDTLKSGLSEAAIAIFQQLVPALRAGLKGLSGLASYIPSITDAFFSFAKSLSFLKPLLVPLGTFLGVLLTLVAGSAALTALGAAFSLLVSPIGLVAAAITAVVLAFATAYKKSEPFRKAINGIGSAFKAVSTIFSNGLKGYGTARNLLEEAGFSKDQIRLILKFSYSLKDAFDKISAIFKSTSSIFGGEHKASLDILTKAGFSENQIALIRKFGYSLKDAFDKVKGVIDGIGSMIMGGESKDLLTALGFSPEMAAKVGKYIDGIRTKISDLLSAFNQGGIGGVFDKIFGEGSFESLKSKFEEVKSYITEKITQFKPIFEQLVGAFSTAWDTVSDILTSAWDIIEPILSGLWDRIQMLGDIVMIVYDNVIAPAISFLTQLFSTLWSIAKPILMALSVAWEALSAVMKWMWDNVLAPLVDFILTGVKNAFDAFTGVLEIVQGAFDTLSGAISSAYGHVKDFIGFIGNVKLPDWVTNGISAGVNFVGGLIGAGGDKGGKKSHYSGLDSVPYDGYSARLHKGERVLTARENREYSEGKGSNGAGGGVVITGNSFTVREEADIEKVAYQLAKLIERQATQIG